MKCYVNIPKDLWDTQYSRIEIRISEEKISSFFKGIFSKKFPWGIQKIPLPPILFACL